MKLVSESAQRSDFVSADLSDARTARIWSRVSPHLNQRRRWPWFAGAATAACAAALILVLARPTGPANSPEAAAGGALVAADVERRLTLGDGSELELAPRTEVVVAKQEPRALELDLKNGRIFCQVAHVPERRFVVRAGNVKVIAVGTRFKVTRHDGPEHGVSVDVEQGVVEVHAAGKVERLLAGQRWESPRPAARAEAPRTEAAEPGAHPAALQPNLREQPNPHEQPKAPAASGSAPAPETPERADARKLFETANHARRAGDMRGAASGYEQLLRSYPADGRATLAALELGRLRMDHLGDNAGAISALNLAARGGGSVREDAMARLVRAYAATGSRDRCLRARENYERSYPEGHHRAEVRAACGSR